MSCALAFVRFARIGGDDGRGCSGWGLEDGTVFYAPLGEVLHDGDDLVCCHLCGRWLRKVGGTHLRVGHGWTLAEYREAFLLLQSTPTCSRDFAGLPDTRLWRTGPAHDSPAGRLLKNRIKLDLISSQWDCRRAATRSPPTGSAASSGNFH